MGRPDRTTTSHLAARYAGSGSLPIRPRRWWVWILAAAVVVQGVLVPPSPPRAEAQQDAWDLSWAHAAYDYLVSTRGINPTAIPNQPGHNSTVSELSSLITAFGNIPGFSATTANASLGSRSASSTVRRYWMANTLCAGLHTCPTDDEDQVHYLARHGIAYGLTGNCATAPESQACITDFDGDSNMTNAQMVAFVSRVEDVVGSIMNNPPPTTTTTTTTVPAGSGCNSSNRLSSLSITENGVEALSGFSATIYSYAVDVDRYSVRLEATAASTSSHVARGTEAIGAPGPTLSDALYLGTGTYLVNVAVRNGSATCVYAVDVTRGTTTSVCGPGQVPDGRGGCVPSGNCVDDGIPPNCRRYADDYVATSVASLNGGEFAIPLADIVADDSCPPNGCGNLVWIDTSGWQGTARFEGTTPENTVIYYDPIEYAISIPSRLPSGDDRPWHLRDDKIAYRTERGDSAEPTGTYRPATAIHVNLTDSKPMSRIWVGLTSIPGGASWIQLLHVVHSAYQCTQAGPPAMTE